MIDVDQILAGPVALSACNRKGAGIGRHPGDASAGVARVGAVVAPVDAALRPIGLRGGHRLPASQMRAQTDLIIR